MVDGSGLEPPLAPDTVRLMCDRRTGIGADGIIVMLQSIDRDIRMRVLNADGGEAEMCGNGIRALFLFAIDKGAAGGSRIEVETGAGTRVVRSLGERDGQKLFSVDMGNPAYRFSDIPMDGPPEEEALGVSISLDDGTRVEATCVSFGNPHCVIFVDNLEGFPVARIGPMLENHDIFPQRTNVEFVEVGGRTRLSARVWERGVGETLACGTGACASLVAARLNGLCESKATVSVPGGVLEVAWERDAVTLTGPARHVFDGRTAD